MVRKGQGRNAHKRTVMYDGQREGWVGWERIVRLFEQAKRLDTETGINEYGLYFVTLFETGARISEARYLTPDQFVWNDDYIKVFNVDVLKRRDSIRVRNIIIKREGDPLSDALIKYVENCTTHYLFPGYGEQFSTEITNDSRPASRTHIWKRITEIDEHIFPHLLRSMRAFSLTAKKEFGGRDFDAWTLRSWYQWSSMNSALSYVGNRDERQILEALDLRPDNTLNYRRTDI